MNTIVILSSIVICYLIFMMSFYLLARLIFPRIEVSEDQELEKLVDEAEAKRLRATRISKRNRPDRFRKHEVQVA